MSHDDAIATVRLAGSELDRLRAALAAEQAAREAGETWIGHEANGREALGRLVRETWTAWARRQPDIGEHPSWLVPWDALPERDRDVDRLIAAAVACAVFRPMAARIARAEAARDEAIALSAAAHEECERLPAIVERAERAERERDEARAAIAAIVEMVTHDVERITSWRQARTSGGQHVGTGGVLGSATPSVLGYLRRLARDAEGYGAPLLAERDALRAEVERLRAALDAAKEGA